MNCSLATVLSFARGASVIFWTIRAECSARQRCRVILTRTLCGTKNRQGSDRTFSWNNLFYHLCIERKREDKLSLQVRQRIESFKSGRCTAHYKFSTLRVAKCLSIRYNVVCADWSARGYFIRKNYGTTQKNVDAKASRRAATGEFAVLFIRLPRFFVKSAACDRISLPDWPLLQPFHAMSIMKINTAMPGVLFRFLDGWYEWSVRIFLI